MSRIEMLGAVLVGTSRKGPAPVILNEVVSCEEHEFILEPEAESSDSHRCLSETQFVELDQDEPVRIHS